MSRVNSIPTPDAVAALADAAARAARYLETLPERAVAPSAASAALLARLGGPLPEQPTDPLEVVRLLDECAAPATVASAGPRYFGFVTGGTLPAALGAAVLAAAWDQNAAFEVMSPAAAALEENAGRWVLELLGLPPQSAVGFTTGATMANLAALAAARHAVLARAGWNAEEDGMGGAPPVSVIVGDEVHVSVLKALSLLGFGRSRLQRVPVDGQGRMRVDAFPALAGPAIVCLQAGNVNTGSFDPLRALCERAHAAGAWVHVDSAFGLWARASPAHAPLADAADLADSWATDAHKWLNTPYDSGLAIVREPQALRAAMAASAAYLASGDLRDGCAFVPELSRRARGVEVWAALRSLGRRGVADLVERCSRLARRFADGARAAGFEVLNDVVLNQALVSFGSAERTQRVIEAVQREGTCWCGGTVWQGRTALRFSVSSWASTEADIDRSLQAITRIANDIG
ncbi:MAG TPA: aminotransferase class V-fold PLP-dependent enzyme [Burkholderiales bacterium]|nr:aminotransferase class V-fold PLP-dependent enzyme [Burkholderiales bacterium]